MNTVRLTVAEALVKYLVAQKIEINGNVESLFGCSFAIFGHGNVTCLGQQLKNVEEQLPTWRGQNEQSMAMAAVAYAKANNRQRIGIAATSIGPGATNMITAAGIAHTNRLPLLMMSGDAYISRLPDPVLQQTEHFHAPSITANDAFKAVTRYWDRVVHPAQLMQTLPLAMDTLLDPADCGPVFLGLPQDVQGMAYDYPERFFEEKIHRIRRPQPESCDLDLAVSILRSAKRPLIISGGGVHYSHATSELADFVQTHNVPVIETIAGRATLLQSNPLNGGPVGATGSDSANYLAAQADVVVAIGTRLQDFTTGSWSVFRDPNLKIISINVGRTDAIKHLAMPIIADAKTTLSQLTKRLGDWRSAQEWSDIASSKAAAWKTLCQQRAHVEGREMASYAQVIGAVNRLAETGDTVLTAAGGLPAELNMNWQSKQIGKFDIEFGFSCMGYDIAGGWGGKIANPDNDVIVLVGDGSYMILNSDIYSSVLTGHKMIIVVCDNAGFAVINKLQNNTGNDSFNNLLADCRRPDGELARVDFAKHAEAQGAISEKVSDMSEFDAAFARAKAADKTSVIVIDIDPTKWSSCDCWWEVGLPEIARTKKVEQAIENFSEGRTHQRPGV